MSVSEFKQEHESVLLSLSADRMELRAFCRWLSDKGGVSIVYEKGIDEHPVSVEFQNQPVSVVLSMVARRFQVEVTKVGSVYYLGNLRREDRGVLVRKVRRLSAPEIKEAIDVLLSDIGRSVTYPDGLVIVGDRVQVIERINSLLDQIESAPFDSWVIQIYLISITDRAETDLGLDIKPSAELSLSLSRVSGALVDGVSGNGALLTASLASMLRASSEVSGVETIAQPLYLLVDGGTAEFKTVEEIPIPRKTVSDAGTVTTSGYDTREAGLICKVGLREVSNKSSLCSVEVELSSVAGYVDESPIIKKQTYNTASVIHSGGVYLLGELRKSDNADSISGIFKSALLKSSSSGKIQIWIRAYRVNADVSVSNNNDVD